MEERGGMRITVTLRWIQILDNLEPFFKAEGEFVFRAKVSTNNHGGMSQETRMPSSGHYSISDHPRRNRLNKLDKVLFEGRVTDHLVIELGGQELDRFSKDDPLELYRREFTGPIGRHLGIIQPGDEGSDDPENMSNWRVGYEITAKPNG